MPKVKRTTAKFDTYERGLRVPSEKTKSGYRLDRSKPADENDRIFCKKGGIYFKWKFRSGGEQRSLTYPKPWQLTQSPFLQQVYQINEEIEGIESGRHTGDFEEIQDAIDSIVSQLEELQEECEEKQSNMEDIGITGGMAYELLEERVEHLGEVIDELNSVNTDILPEECDEDDEEALEERENEIHQLWSSLIEEITNIQYEGS